MRSVIVCGPPGCGKTLHAVALRQLFGCRSIVDDWLPARGLADGALHLTQMFPADELPFEKPDLLCVSFDDAMAKLNDSIDAAVTL